MAIALLATACLIAVIAVIIALIYIAQLHRRWVRSQQVNWQLRRRVRHLSRHSFPAVYWKDWMEV